MAAVAPAWLLGLFLLRTTAAEEAFEDNGVRCQYRQIKDKARRKEDLFRGKRERHTHIYIYIHTKFIQIHIKRAEHAGRSAYC